MEDYRIALINPRVESYISTLPPLGLLYIAAVLEKNGFSVKVFDMYPYDDRDMPSFLSYAPHIIGMTVLTDYWPRAQHIADIVRRDLPNSTFVVGGVHVTVLPEESIKLLDAHIGVIGEGENTMLELCKRAKKGTDWREVSGIVFRDKDSKFIRTSPRPYISNLDQLPYPARHLLDFENYLVPPGMIRGHWSERSTTVMTSRGCPFKCIWCGSRCTFGQTVRYRSVYNVIDEIQSLIKNYFIDAIWFVDDTFTLSRDRVLEFCKGIIASNIRLKWGCQVHARTADEEMFEAMKKAGCLQLDFGVESGSNRVLKSLNKKSDTETIERAFSIAKKAGLRTFATFIFGSPSETEEDVKASFELVKKIKPNYTSSYFLTPYPGTKLMEMVKTNNWKMASERGGLGLKRRPRLLIYFSEKDLLRIRKRFQQVVAFRNFFSLLFSPRYVLKAAGLFLRYSSGLFCSIKAFTKTFVFDDFLFAFLNYYISHKSENPKLK